MVQNCPIDVRRGLYKNIVLSGGSTMFKVGTEIRVDTPDSDSDTADMSIYLTADMLIQLTCSGLWEAAGEGREEECQLPSGTDGSHHWAGGERTTSVKL